MRTLDSDWLEAVSAYSDILEPTSNQIKMKRNNSLSFSCWNVLALDSTRQESCPKFDQVIQK